MKKTQRRAFIQFALSICTLVFVSHAALARSYGRHDGYLSSVKDERHLIVEEVVIVHPPEEDPEALRKKIFNAELTKEFNAKYEERFGRTGAERAYFYRGRFDLNDNQLVKLPNEDVLENRRKFGEYILRRTMEYHVDNFVKNDPKIRPAYEFKERISQVKVEILPKIEITAKYSFSGNFFDIYLKNPWFRCTTTLQMDAGKAGPSAVQETIVALGKDVGNFAFDSYYRFADGIASGVITRPISPTLGSTFTFSTFTHRHGVSPRENLYLAGLSYAY